MAHAVEQLKDALNGIEPPKPGRKRKVVINEGYQFAWVQRGDGFALDLPDEQGIRLQKQLDKWVAFAILNSKKIKAERPTLEEAFKAVDRFYYTEAKDWWLKTNIRAVIEPWMGDLNFDTKSNRSNAEVDGGW